MAVPVQTFIDRLTETHRVVVLGGLAVIAHGYSRHTQDADVWLDPLDSAEKWAGVLAGVRIEFPQTTIHRLPGWTEVADAEIAAAGDPFSQAILEGREIP